MDIRDIQKAKKIIQPHIKKTPLKQSNFFSQLCKGNIFLKLENQQITNSFKIRGALNKMLQLSKQEKDRGIVAASAGNHGQAVGVGAEKLNLSAKIFVPKSTPQKKIEKIRICDAELLIQGDNFKETENKAISYAKDNNMTYISPYNDELVVAGQGTLGLEILQDLPKVDIILVPVGGGGLISGIGVAVKTKNSKIKIIGVQSDASPVMHKSLKAGKIVEVPIENSIADGISGGLEQGSITFNLSQRYVDQILLVKEESISKAIKLLWENEKEISEGAGAVGLAAILDNKKHFRNKNTVVIISGGNIDDVLFQNIIKN
jgi:threonine dehydratase